MKQHSYDESQLFNYLICRWYSCVRNIQEGKYKIYTDMVDKQVALNNISKILQKTTLKPNSKTFELNW